MVGLIVVAVLALLAVLVARANAQPILDDDPAPMGAPQESSTVDDGATGEDAEPVSSDARRARFDVAAVPPISAVIAAAYRAAELERDPAPSWRARTRLAGLVPWISIRGGRDATWRDVADPTIGYVSVFTISATWHLDRLVFDPNELRISAIEAGRRRERRRIAELSIRAYYDWLATGSAEPVAMLDALTEGWFTPALARASRGSR
jgi:hypothetical protein